MSWSAAPSRLSLHKSTPPNPGDSAALRRAALREPLTRRDGVKLREECFDGHRVKTMRETVWEWRDAVEDNRDTWATYENQDGDRETVEMTDRFTPEKFDQRYAQLNDLVDGVKEAFGRRRLTTVLISPTASSTDDDGYPRPPVDHMLDLKESEDAINSALDRVLDGYRWERILLPEQHKSGYIHWHWAILIDGSISPEEFQPVIESHLNNCPTAEREAHQILPDEPKKSAVSVRESVENLPAYLMAYTLGEGDEYGHDPLEAPEERQMMLALLWATNRRYWRPSEGARDYMKYGEYDLPDWWATLFERWKLVGFSNGENGELHELPPEWTGGGVTMFETWEPPPG